MIKLEHGHYYYGKCKTIARWNAKLGRFTTKNFEPVKEVDWGCNFIPMEDENG